MATTTDRLLDLLIIGRGPAGVSCALQARRDGLDLLLLGDEPVGGLVCAARRLDNLAGARGVTGPALAARMAEQLAVADVPLLDARVAALRRGERGFVGALDDGRTIHARTVCLATGTAPRPWTAASPGNGVLRDARTLPQGLAGSHVVVVGGGEAALDTALSAADRGARVTILVRGARPAAAPGLLAEAVRAGIELRCDAAVQGVDGGSGRWTIRCRDGAEVAAQVLLACVGREPRDALFRGLTGGAGPAAAVEQPGRAGVFAAGDLIRGQERYVATALGDGQRAALAAAAFLGGRE
jgi:thioredoxin reductase